MTSHVLAGKKVAILATHGFEEAELFDTKKGLDEAGAETKIISLELGDIKAWRNGNWGRSIAVDQTIGDASARDFDAVLLPGGVLNADKLRGEQAAIFFVTDFIDAGKPVAAICHAPWILIETGNARGRKMTSWASLKTDLINAGVDWVDKEVVQEDRWVTSRKPADIPAFNKAMIEEFAIDTPIEDNRTPASPQVDTYEGLEFTRH